VETLFAAAAAAACEHVCSSSVAIESQTESWEQYHVHPFLLIATLETSHSCNAIPQNWYLR
jgi:hypothetical protein